MAEAKLPYVYLPATYISYVFYNRLLKIEFYNLDTDQDSKEGHDGKLVDGPGKTGYYDTAPKITKIDDTHEVVSKPRDHYNTDILQLTLNQNLKTNFTNMTLKI